MGVKTKDSKCDVVGAAAVEVFASYGDRLRLTIQADSQNTGLIYVTLDGSTPSSTNYNYELTAGSAFVFDRAVPSGAVKVIGSLASQRYSAEQG